MSDVVLKVEGLSKKFCMSLKRSMLYGTYDVARDMLSVPQKDVKLRTSEFWALQDINFELKRGETLGLIGQNGCGKTTLLRLINGIFPPDKGKITINGRIGALIAVGAGFHPHMTGRENVYLNGAILGMTKAEIKSKFDEIVDFSGVERYIDTPVKRYSSGMYVRLAFAVAAHLEPEILVVDEVLAVGDSEFQKKALGKMQEVSKGQGRTVLFVSHNMAAMQNLCENCILLLNGTINFHGESSRVIDKYLSQRTVKNKSFSETKERLGNGLLHFTNGLINGKSSNDFIGIEAFKTTEFELHYTVANDIKIQSARIDIGINNHLGVRVAWLSSDILGTTIDLTLGKIIFCIDSFPLAPGDYNCNIYCEINGEVADWLTEVLNFSILEKDYYMTGRMIPIKQGNILLKYIINYS